MRNIFNPFPQKFDTFKDPIEGIPSQVIVVEDEQERGFLKLELARYKLIIGSETENEESKIYASYKVCIIEELIGKHRAYLDNIFEKNFRHILGVNIENFEKAFQEISVSLTKPKV